MGAADINSDNHLLTMIDITDLTALPFTEEIWLPLFQPEIQSCSTPDSIQIENKNNKDFYCTVTLAKIISIGCFLICYRVYLNWCGENLCLSQILLLDYAMDDSGKPLESHVEVWLRVVDDDT